MVKNIAKTVSVPSNPVRARDFLPKVEQLYLLKNPEKHTLARYVAALMRFPVRIGTVEAYFRRNYLHVDCCIQTGFVRGVTTPNKKEKERKLGVPII